MKTIRLSFQGKKDDRTYIIYQLDGMSTIGAMWSVLEQSKSRAEIESIFKSEKYADCKKYNELAYDSTL